MIQNFIDAVDWFLLDQLQRDASLSNQALAELAKISAPTCLRRIRRLHEAGLITAQVTLLNEDAVAALRGHGLTAVAEVSLDRQGDEHMNAFEERAVADLAVTQCYRVSPGPDFILMIRVDDMPGYQALAQRLFTQDANVRNVKVFFSVKRGKFETRMPLNYDLGRREGKTGRA
ncbi:Lrp/AsnC family transcriptional regulator [Ottowia thiooxydans]|uniref:Lrp/AsnC family transcriptional regulator n=1 Tax=Ottowia thiooxydans TaxID=219182 RepID=UPI00040BB1AB|nr:Lrp/AsnC family transcriptional regulator [Ottowia thiooxydans]